MGRSNVSARNCEIWLPLMYGMGRRRSERVCLLPLLPLLGNPNDDFDLEPNQQMEEEREEGASLIGLYRRLFPVASVVRVRPPIVNCRLLAVGDLPHRTFLKQLTPTTSMRSMITLMLHKEVPAAKSNIAHNQSYCDCDVTNVCDWGLVFCQLMIVN